MAKIDGLEIVMTKQMQKMIDKELKKRIEELKPELATRYEELLNMRNMETDQFNDGFNDARAGKLETDHPHYDFDTDNWRLGFAWGMFEPMKEKLARERQVSDALYLLLVDDPNTKLLADQILINIFGKCEPSPSDVSVTQDVSTDIKTGQSIENTNPDYYKAAEKTALVRLCGVLGVLTENNDLATAALLAATRIESLEKKIPALNVDLAEASMHAYNGEVARMKLEAENARLTAELAELRERFEVTDDLLNQATVTIGAVIACCTYNSNEDAKIGIYGISPDAFTRIDQFITNYNRAVSAGKVSVDVKPVQRPADPSLEEDEFDSMPIEKINQYLREHGYNPEKVGLRGKILAEALTKNIIAHKIIQRFIDDPYGCRFCDFGVLRKPGIPEKDHDEDCLYLAARAYLDNDTSTVVKNTNPDYYNRDFLGGNDGKS